MERVSDERLDTMIMSYGAISRHNQEAHNYIFLALTELRERREKEKAPCPEHEKRVEKWPKKCTCSRCRGFDVDAYYQE